MHTQNNYNYMTIISSITTTADQMIQKITQLKSITIVESWKDINVRKDRTHDGYEHVHDIITEGFYFVGSILPPDHGKT